MRLRVVEGERGMEWEGIDQITDDSMKDILGFVHLLFMLLFHFAMRGFARCWDCEFVWDTLLLFMCTFE